MQLPDSSTRLLAQQAARELTAAQRDRVVFCLAIEPVRAFETAMGTIEGCNEHPENPGLLQQLDLVEQICQALEQVSCSTASRVIKSSLSQRASDRAIELSERDRQ